MKGMTPLARLLLSVECLLNEQSSWESEPRKRRTRKDPGVNYIEAHVLAWGGWMMDTSSSGKEVLTAAYVLVTQLQRGRREDSQTAKQFSQISWEPYNQLNSDTVDPEVVSDSTG